MLNTISENLEAVYMDYTARNKNSYKNEITAYSPEDVLQDSILNILESQVKKESVYSPPDINQAKKLLATITMNLKINRGYRDDTKNAYCDELKKSGVSFDSQKHDFLTDHIKSNLSDITEQEIFELYYIAGYKGVEIAEKLNIDVRQAQRIIKKVSNKIMKMNLTDLIDSNLVGDIAGIEHHKLSLGHFDSYHKSQCQNHWEFWPGQSDFSDYVAEKKATYNITKNDGLDNEDKYVFLKKGTYTNMLNVDMS